MCRPDMDDLPHTEWKCDQCGAENSMWDGDCQFCDGEDAHDFAHHVMAWYEYISAMTQMEFCIFMRGRLQ